MTDDWLTLAADERVVWRGRPRRSAALPSAGAGAGLLAGGIALWLAGPGTTLARLAGVALALLGVAAAVGGYLRVVNTRYVVTDRSLSVRRGVLTLSVSTVPRAKVQDSASRQDVTGALLGYGTVSFDTAGGDRFAFERIDDPDRVRSLVAGGETQAQLPGSAEQWRAVRTEVRALRAALDRRGTDER